MLENILMGCIANFLTVVATLIAGYFVVWWFDLRSRRELLKFLGITKERPTLRVYLSRIQTKEGGTIGVPGENIAKGYVGPAITKVEYEGANKICDALKIEVLAHLPKLRDWLGKQRIEFRIIEPQILISPSNEGEIKSVSDNLVLLGNGIYNLASKIYLEDDRFDSLFCFAKRNDVRGVFWNRGPAAGHPVDPGRSAGHEIGTIQRIRHPDIGNTVFICAGTGSSATFGSVRYLIDHWQELHNKHGSNNFAYYLTFLDQEPDCENGDEVKQPVLHVP